MFRRKMEFGGNWYPKGREACERSIRSFWEKPLPADTAPARYGVVPHAGWIFSGRLAARVFKALPDDPETELVVVMGGHLREGDPVVAMVEGSWETPFGELPIHTGFRTQLEDLSGVIFENEGRFYADNSTELQLPFVKYKYPRAELLPLRVPPGNPAIRLGKLLGEYLHSLPQRSVVIASTDLTHYGPAYGFEPVGRGEGAVHWVRTENDPAYIDAMASGDGGRILAVARERHNACSPGGVAALAEIAKSEQAVFRTLGYATSQDVKPHDAVNFVGYVGGIFSQSTGSQGSTSDS